MEIKAGQRYKHFKGGDDYVVVALAKHSETLEDFMIYKHDGGVWIRPRKMWFDEVDRPGLNYRGPRFQLVD